MEAKLIFERSTTPTKMATIVVAAIDNTIPPRTRFKTKKMVMKIPNKATRTAGLLKSTKPGVAIPLAVIAACALSAPFPVTL